MGRPDLLAPAPSPARAARRTLSRLRAADIHRVAESARRSAIDRLVRVDASGFDPMRRVDDRLEAALAVDSTNDAAPIATRERRTIEQHASTRPVQRRAPLASRARPEAPGGPRRAGTSTVSGSADRSVAPGLPASGAVASAPDTTDGRANVPVDRHSHPLSGAVTAARHRPVGARVAALEHRLAHHLPRSTDAPTARRAPRALPSDPFGREPSHRSAGGTSHAATERARRDFDAPAVHHRTQPDRADFERPAADPTTVASAAHTQRVVGLVGLAEHFDHAGRGAGRTVDDHAPAAPSNTPVQLQEWTRPPHPTPASVAADQVPASDGASADRDLPASDLVVARRLADIIGEVVAADARQHGIDLEGFHAP